MGGVGLLAALSAAAAAALAVGREPGFIRLRRLPVGVRRGSGAPEPPAADGPAGRPAGPPNGRAGSPPGLAGSLNGGAGSPDGPAGAASRWVRGGTAILAGLAGSVLVGGGAGPLVGAALGAGVWWWLSRLEPAGVVRARNQTAAALPLVAELLAAALAAGSPPERAAEAVGRSVGPPLGPALLSAAASLRLGAEPAVAWEPLRRDPQLRSLGRALVGAGDRGTSPVPALERVAQDACDSLRWAAEARARSLGARAAAPLGLCFLPAFVLVGVVPVVVTVGLPLLP